MDECGRISPHPFHDQEKCNLYPGHPGLHKHVWRTGGYQFWSDEDYAKYLFWPLVCLKILNLRKGERVLDPAVPADPGERG